MKSINKHLIVLSFWDSLRFIFLGAILLPLVSAGLQITGDVPTNYRILLWLLAPQLILPGYLAAVAFGRMSEQGLKPLLFITKLLSLIPAVLTVSALMAANQIQSGALIADQDELNVIIRITAVVIMDLVFCVILLAYKSRISDAELPTESAGAG